MKLETFDAWVRWLLIAVWCDVLGVAVLFGGAP